MWALGNEAPELRERISPDRPYLMAEVVHAARSEWAGTLADVLVRRVPVAFETRDNGREAAARVAQLLGRELGWNDRRRDRELERFESEVTATFGILPD